MQIKQFSDSIRLKNSGNLEVFFLGTGSAFSKKYSQTNLLLIKGKDHLLVDCGSLCPLAFYSYNSKIADIDNVLITHSHADHIGGLEELSLIGMYQSQKKINMIITDSYKDFLWNNSLKGGLSYGENTDGQSFCFEDYFNQITPALITKTPRPFYESKLGDMDIITFRTKHIPHSKDDWDAAFFSCGLLIDKKVLYSGDTRFDRELLDFVIEKYPTIETIFHDCQFFPGGVHSFYENLKTLPIEIKEKMLLSHYGDLAENYKPEEDGFKGFAKAGVYYNFD